MGFNIGKIASTVSTVANLADSAGLLSGINIGSLDASNIGGLKSSIQSALNGQMGSIESQLQSAIMPSDLESIVNGFDIEGKANELQSQIQVPSSIDAASFDQSNVDAEVNKMMEEINSKMKSSMDFSSISYM